MLQTLPAANQPGQPEAPRLGIRLLPHSTQRVTVLRQPRGPMGKPESEAPKYSHVFLLITVDSTAEFHRLLLIPQSSSHFPISSVNGKRPGYQKMSHLMIRLKHEKHLLAKGIRLLLAQNSQCPQEGSQLRGPVSPSQYHNLGTRNQYVNAGTKLLDEAKTGGLLPAFSLSPGRDPTFKVSLWDLSPSRILCPPPMRSSMPW